MIAGLVLAVLLLSVRLVAAIVQLPTVLSVTLKVLAPLTNAAFAGSVALLSEEVTLMVSVALVTRFQ